MNYRALILDALHDGPQTYLALWEICHGHGFWCELQRLIREGIVTDIANPQDHTYKLKEKK